MCGIVAIIRRPSTRAVPTAAQVLTLANGATKAFDADSVEALNECGRSLQELNALLLGVPGAIALLQLPGLVFEVTAQLEPLVDALASAADKAFERGIVIAEGLNAARRSVKDTLWAVLRDRLSVPDGIKTLGGSVGSRSQIAALCSVHDALSALDRLEVRGRDSLGLHLFVSGHGENLDEPALARAISERSGDPSFVNNAVRRVGDVVSFVYKESAEIGDLGDNTDALRRAIAADELLSQLLGNEGTQVMVVGHTRWASVGIISQANAHPVNSDVDGHGNDPYFVAALNGDVDNYADLAAEAGLNYPTTITTDAKVIPSLVADRVRGGQDTTEAFRSCVASFDGSVAIALAGAHEPDMLRLAQRGSGQALYVGLAEDTYVVASEPYGVVELTSNYVRLDGETPVDPTNPASARGQILTLDRNEAGTLRGLSRQSYDGTPLPMLEHDVVTAEITTSDIDRAGYPHFLLKEISEAPNSFRNTLSGKLTETDGNYQVQVSDGTLPAAVRQSLAGGAITRVLGIGQGTAAIAARSFAEALAAQVDGKRLQVSYDLATELSGFGLESDMSDVLIVAVSQSGTTTDTNRTVDLARERGASVIGIVNRRGSDLTDKADGVLYTSDGRDVEMSVASTKAFYSQIAAGFLLATAIADQIGRPSGAHAMTQRVLAGLADLPQAMESVIASREHIGEVAARLAPSKQYWAIVGSGSNRIAAEEVRVKLSELCYKAIACDSIEDKKHIDLSSEPLILVCAAGLQGSTADDAVKEVSIFRAHKATPVVIAAADENRFGTTDVISVPVVEPELGFVLSALVGHLFGYEAALAIDSLAMPLRKLRAAIDAEVASQPDSYGSDMLARIQPAITQARSIFGDGLRKHRYNGHLSSSTAVDMALLLRYASGVAELGSYGLDFGKVGTPAVVIDDLARVVAKAIDELTRPIDAIKHQAKTVTVGISRTDESLLHVPLVARTIEAGASRDALTYSTLRTLAGIDAAVVEVLGFTRYSIQGDVVGDGATISIIDRGGISVGIASRVDIDPVLRGTKHRVATECRVLITRGRRDQRLIVFVPEVKDTETVGITLLYIKLADSLTPNLVRAVLQAYHGRYDQIRDAVLETEASFDETPLTVIPLDELLVRPAVLIADHWRTNDV
jgi:glucosamine--fructose-6-phosphate aminotransferase (isomerizing)